MMPGTTEQDIEVTAADNTNSDDEDSDVGVTTVGSSKIEPDSLDLDDTKGDDEEDSEDEGSIKSSATDHTPAKKNSKRSRASAAKRIPSVAGLTIPFRTVKKAMKLDPDTPIVQNEAAIMTTIAVELFVKSLAVASLENAKSRGRTNVRYEDIAEARSKNKAMAFLEPLLP
jgi:histone H3/H4